MIQMLCALQLIVSGPASAIDGDTLRIDGLEKTVRLWGIDAPEMRDSGGEAAKSGLSDLVSYAQVECHTRGNDRYGRYVARCYVGGRDLASEMIRAGHAREWCKYSKGFYGGCEPSR